MLACVTGKVVERTDKSAIVLTSGGAGYELFLTGPALAALPGKDQEVFHWVQTVVREDAIELYGFPTFEERRLFALLISISKLGPKKALSILSLYDPDALRAIAAREDAAAMQAVPGIGKKTGQQILFELKFKLKDELTAPAKGAPKTKSQGEFADALAGLAGLGYADEEVRPLLADMFEEEPDLDAASAIRLALKRIAQARNT